LEKPLPSDLGQGSPDVTPKRGPRRGFPRLNECGALLRSLRRPPIALRRASNPCFIALRPKALCYPTLLQYLYVFKYSPLVYQQTENKGLIGFVSQSPSFLIAGQGQVEMAIGGRGPVDCPRSTPWPHLKISPERHRPFERACFFSALFR